jgi:hypothetical protein
MGIPYWEARIGEYRKKKTWRRMQRRKLEEERKTQMGEH